MYDNRPFIQQETIPAQQQPFVPQLMPYQQPLIPQPMPYQQPLIPQPMPYPLPPQQPFIPQPMPYPLPPQQPFVSQPMLYPLPPQQPFVSQPMPYQQPQQQMMQQLEGLNNNMSVPLNNMQILNDDDESNMFGKVAKAEQQISSKSIVDDIVNSIFGIEKRAEIRGAVDALHSLNDNDANIKTYIMKKYNLSEEQAAPYCSYIQN